MNKKKLLRRRLSSLLIAVISSSAGFSQAEDLVLNGDFSDGYSPWETPGWWADGGGTFKVDEDNRFCVTVTTLGSDDWGAQFRLNNLTFVSGETYDVSLTAWSSTAMEVSMSAIDESDNFVWIFGTTLEIDSALESDGQDLSYSFTAEAGSEANGKFRFLLGAGAVPVDETICFDDISINGPELEEAEETTVRIRINQIGYLPNSPKKAVYKIEDDASDFSTPRLWSLMLNGSEVANGETIPHGDGIDSASGDLVHSIDFDDYKVGGTGYTLEITDADKTYSSNTFPISSNIYSQVKYDALAYFYHNRSGIEIEADVVGETWSRPAGHEADSNVETLTCSTDSTADDCISIDSSGGWYDAGDHGKYVVNGGISIWTLLNQYERLKYLGAGTTDFNDGTMALPTDEISNGIPDILDEASWEIEWFLKMQVDENQELSGMVYHKMHDENWTGLPLAPHEDTQTRYVHDASTTATLNFAAVGAQCYRIFQEYDTDLAERCLTQAKIAYIAALKNPAIYANGDNSSGGGPYDDNDASDEFYWAASELYITTGDETYADDMKASKWHQTTPSNMSWQVTYPLAVISLATVGTATNEEDDFMTGAREALISLADSYVQNAQDEGYGLPYSANVYPWGSNSNIVNNMIILGLAYDFTAEEDYINAMLQGANYIFGHNPLSHSYVTGYGTTYEKYPHHRFWAEVLDANYPPAPAGAMSGGPNSGLEDTYAATQLYGCAPQKCFVDNITAWSVNEITINWNAPFSWVTAYLDEYADITNDSEVSDDDVNDDDVNDDDVNDDDVIDDDVNDDDVNDDDVNDDDVNDDESNGGSLGLGLLSLLGILLLRRHGKVIIEQRRNRKTA